MKKIVFILIVLFIATSCSLKKKKQEVQEFHPKPFKLTVLVDNFMESKRKYILTEKKIVIINISPISGILIPHEKGTAVKDDVDTLISKSIKPDKTLEQLSNINIDTLRDFYSNNNIMDGQYITVELNKQGKVKEISLDNYYNKQIGIIITQLNKFIPKEYKIIYN